MSPAQWLCSLALVSITTGCMGKKKFDKKNAEELCQLYEACEVLDIYGYSSIEECDADLRDTFNECDDYDKKAAKSCLKEMKSAECEASSDDDGGESDCASICSGSSDDTGG